MTYLSGHFFVNLSVFRFECLLACASIDAFLYLRFHEVKLHELKVYLEVIFRVSWVLVMFVQALIFWFDPVFIFGARKGENVVFGLENVGNFGRQIS